MIAGERWATVAQDAHKALSSDMRAHHVFRPKGNVTLAKHHLCNWEFSI
jgi:hypothetical protein